MTQDPEKIRETLIGWFAASRKRILTAMAQPLDVAQKAIVMTWSPMSIKPISNF